MGGKGIEEKPCALALSVTSQDIYFIFPYLRFLYNHDRMALKNVI